MKFILSLSISALLIISTAYSQLRQAKETKEESKVCDLVARLPEVINADNYVKKVTKGKRHLFSYLASYPTKENPYYWVNVVEDNGTSLHAHFHFYIEPKTYKIMYLDAATDKTMPEKQCRKKLLDEYRIN